MTRTVTAYTPAAQSDINKKPAFRAQFHAMCAKIGVDPLASNKGFWAELLGIGDFYYELGKSARARACARLGGKAGWVGWGGECERERER
eukprot:jgi/Mesen1/6191/ME000032S05490